MIHSAALGSAPRLIPDLPSVYRPGQPRPSAHGCTFFYPEYDFEYCSVGRDTYLSSHNGIIEHASIMVYNDDIKAGDLLVAWGAPSTAIYYIGGSAMLYWPSKSAYIATSAHLSAYSRVGFLSYGDEDQGDGSWPTARRYRWQGFKSR